MAARFMLWALSWVCAIALQAHRRQSVERRHELLASIYADLAVGTAQMFEDANLRRRTASVWAGSLEQHVEDAARAFVEPTK